MVEKSYPELIPYLSTCKSPQMMMGAVIKNFFAAEHDIKPEEMMSVSIMPCVRKQGAQMQRHDRVQQPLADALCWCSDGVGPANRQCIIC
jgi:iron only hydrogenase large subunit-like protein